MNRSTIVDVVLRSYAVEGIGIQAVLLHVTVTVVYGDRPETFYRNIIHGQGVRYQAVVARRRGIQMCSSVWRITAVRVRSPCLPPDNSV